ncbi:glycosyltransferase family 2 protein [uncultured Bacteroides sp.]|uniref:glycosyltransferase family 2 protein n=1 Tax=uncultured Bacteroides sp. TaxID=162156 RepID=UPI002606E152|nr:glycosyltransferase family 2 protein [uncultured Bacteroides sp.]
MKISVITATWNSAKTLQDTIDSVLKQIESCKEHEIEIEHIIKDGGSYDGTIDIIKSNEHRYAGRLRWISERDKGIYDAMNKGIEFSTGDIIGILNSDDFYTSDDVLKTVAVTFINNSEHLDAVYGDIHFVKCEDLKKCTRYFSSRFFQPWLLRFGFMPAHPSFYCRKEVYKKYGLYDLNFKTSSDFEYMVRVFSKNPISALYINKDFVTMRLGGESTANLSSKKKVNKDISNSLKKHGIYTNQLFQIVRYIWRIGEIIYTKIRY